MKTTPRLDFAWTSLKDYACLVPLYEEVVERGWDANLVKIHRHLFRNRRKVAKLAEHVVAAYDVPLKRLELSGWEGKTIYVDHGVGPIKYYAYRYRHFHESALLFYQGAVFQRKMQALNPGFSHGLMGGFTKMDQLVRLEIDREEHCRQLGLDPDEPIVLFAPTWGGKASDHWGIRNARYLDGFPNLVIAPHPADYRYAKQFDAVIPETKGNINTLVKLADVVVSDVSSIVGEAAAIDKTIVQMELPVYPGCFPSYDKRKEGSCIPDAIIDHEIKTSDRESRPFKVAYLDEDWILGHTAKPEHLPRAVRAAIAEPDRYAQERRYWGEQCCWRADGRTNSRIADMIDTFIATGERLQVDDRNLANVATAPEGDA